MKRAKAEAEIKFSEVHEEREKWRSDVINRIKSRKSTTKQHSRDFKDEERDIVIHGRKKSDGRSPDLKSKEMPNSITVSLPSIRASAATIIK